MRTLTVIGAALVVAGAVQAQEQGRVISTTPVVQQVAVPRQVCTNEEVAVAQPKTGAGALLGAVAGGAVGNAVGGGSGRAAATMAGVVVGAVIGDRVEAEPASRTALVQRCSTQHFYESRTVAYLVAYEYAGRQYSVQMAQDPGPTVQLQISPVGAAPANPVGAPPPMYLPPPPVPVGAAPQVVYPAYYPSYPGYPVYPGYPAPYYYPPVGVNLGIGYGGGGHRHWR